ncbi:collagen-flanked surface repeat-containing protein [Bittarella massiliensis (ex Durand et al. 2017)]|uniref:collagen-flanked surface repeat-containing protein n=1 Tax=Bittarella massiliensis (ex Durand et al. 2017) TaxID=1720313 RepID=UPI001AA125DB|nr:hypothetical protein [Bittarella massiliensis (ex Durand et al. 2017)]MBO1680186.1 hypothetical protein [Bittarella massiliensis (ex Durand et al. 2017)]
MIRTHVRPINGRDIPIGRKGETMARDIDFTDIINEIKNDYGDGGKVVVLVRRSGEETTYPAASVDESKGLVWTPTSTDTAIAGRGSVEVDYYVGDTLVKSVLFTTRVKDALDVTGETPEPGYDYMKQVLEALEKVGTGIVEVKQNDDSSVTFVMSDKTEYTTKPLKGADGDAGVSPTVKTESIEGGTRVTITDASGEHSFDVMNGVGGEGGTVTAPTIGENGNWYINGQDTGKPSRGENGADGKDGAPGAPGADGAPGVPGKDGKPGADGADGFSPTVHVEDAEGSHTVTITDKTGDHRFTVHDGQNGAPGKDGAPGAKGDPGQDGAPGADGQDGTDGVSPTVSTENIAGGTRVTITDKGGAHAFDVMNGKDGGEAATPTIGENGNWYINGVDTQKPSRGERGENGADGAPGQDGAPGVAGADGKDGAPGAKGDPGEPGADGFSPTVQVSEGEGTHTVTITDKSGAHAFTVHDGQNGQDGAPGKDGAPGAKGDPGEPGTPGADGAPGAPGADGFSPTVTTAAVYNGTKVTITDKDGPKEFTVKNGTDGKKGIRGTGIYVATKAPAVMSDGRTYQFDVGTIKPSISNERNPYYGDTVISPDGILYHLTSTANSRLAARYEDENGEPISIKGADGGGGGDTPKPMALTLKGSDIYQLFKSSSFTLAHDGANVIWGMLGDEKVTNVKAELTAKTGEFRILFDILCDMGNATEPMNVGCTYDAAGGKWGRAMSNMFTGIAGMASAMSPDAMRLNGGIIDAMHVQKAGDTGAGVIGVFREVVNPVSIYPEPTKPVYELNLNLEGITLDKVSKGDTVQVAIKGHVPVLAV